MNTAKKYSSVTVCTVCTVAQATIRMPQRATQGMRQLSGPMQQSARYPRGAWTGIPGAFVIIMRVEPAPSMADLMAGVVHRISSQSKGSSTEKKTLKVKSM